MLKMAEDLSFTSPCNSAGNVVEIESVISDRFGTVRNGPMMPRPAWLRTIGQRESGRFNSFEGPWQRSGIEQSASEIIKMFLTLYFFATFVEITQNIVQNGGQTKKNNEI